MLENKEYEVIKVIGSVYLSFYESDLFNTYVFGGDMFLINALGILMLVDILTGISKAIVNKDLWSRKTLFGVMRKVVVFVIIIASNIIDVLIGMNGILVHAVVLFYITNELISILENAAQLGIPLPPKLVDALAVMNDKEPGLHDTFKNDFVGIAKHDAQDKTTTIEVIEKDDNSEKGDK